MTITEDQMKTLILEANAVNPFVQMNIPTLEAWMRNLGDLEPHEARAALKVHEDTPVDRGQRPAPDPAGMRRWVMQAREREHAKRLALEAKPVIAPTTGTWRSRNPELWDRLKAEGAVDRLEDLERRGLIGDDQARLDHYRATGVLPKPGNTPPNGLYAA